MRCNRVEQLLPAYLDGDLSSRINEQLSAHLDGCEQCRRAIDSQQRAVRALDGGRYAPSIDLWAQFSRRLEEQARPQPPRWHFLWQPGLAGALATMVVSLVLLSAPERRPDPQRLPSPPRTVQMARAPQAPTASLDREASVRSLGPERPRTLRPGAARDRSPEPPSMTTRRPRRTTAVRLVRYERHRVAPVSFGDGPAGSRLRRSTRSHRADKGRDRGAMRLASLPDVVPTVALTNPPLTGGSVDAGPADVAEALMSVQHDAASDQMQGELLLMAREVARVSGELPTPANPAESAGT